MTEEYRIDLSQERDALQDAAAALPGFPDYYGRNLDALYDVLTCLSEPLTLVLTGTPSVYGEGFRDTVLDAAEENRKLHIILI